MPQPFRRPARVAAWVLVALLGAGCSLFRDPVATPVGTPPPPSTPLVATPAPAAQPSPEPTDVEALIIAAAARQTGYPESLIRAMAASRGIDIEQVVANLGIPPEDVDDILAEMQSRGIDTVREFQAFVLELQDRYDPGS